MDKQQQQYARQVWQKITSSKAYQQADYATKQRIRSDWQDEHVTPYQSGGKSVPAARVEARQGMRIEPAEPARQTLRSTERRSAAPPPSYQNSDVGNALLTGWSNTAAAKASEAKGRPLLPPGTLRPVEGGALQALSMAQPFAEQIALTAGSQLSPLGPVAGNIVGSVAGNAPKYAAEIEAGNMTPEQGRDWLGIDAATAAIVPAIDKFGPSGTLARSAITEGTQGLLQTEIDAAGKGIAPTPGSIAFNMIPGMVTRGLSTGFSGERQQLRQAADAADHVLRDLAADERGQWLGWGNAINRLRGRQTGQPQGAGATGQPQTGLSQQAQTVWNNAGQQAQPAAAAPPPVPPRPPAAAPAPAPVPPPQGPQSTTAPSGMVGTEAGRAKPTPAMKRVYGADVENVRPSSEAADALADVANVMDDPARPPITDPNAVAAARQRVDNGDYFNWRRSGLSGQTQQNMANRIAEVVAENGWDPKQRIGFDQIQAEAKQVSPELLQHLAKPKDGETLHPAVRLAARENLQAISTRVDDMQTDMNARRTSMTADEIRDTQQQIDMLNRDAKRLLDVLIPTRSQDGRNLAYHAITARNNFDVDYWSSRAARAAGVQSLPDADVTTVRDLTLRGQRAQAAGNAAEVDAARLDLARYLAKLEKSTALETASAVIKAGLLTSPKTHARNIAGNTVFQLAEEASRLPAALFDMAMSYGGGRRTISGPSIRALGRAAQEGATTGWREAGQIMRDGATEDALRRFELPRELNSGHRWLDRYTNFVFRSLSAEDRLFRSAATRRSLDDQALVIATNEAKAGTIPRNQIRQRAAQLAAQPDDAMMVNALAAADIATFQNDNAASRAWGAGMRTLQQHGNTTAKFVAETAVAPFVKTPTNVVARMLDYMGVGTPRVARAVVRRLRGTLTPEEQRAASQAFGRGLVGWGMILLGRAAYRAGIATGLTTEEEAGMRGANQVADRPEGAIRVGNRWLQLTGLAPLGGLFVLGATLEQEGEQKSADPLKPVVNQIAAATQVVMQNPFAQGAQNVLSSAKDPLGTGARWITGLPSMAVPTAVNDVAQAIDGTQRQAFSKSANPAVNVARQVMAKVPGARQLLPEKTDPFGRPLPANRAAAIDPFNSKPATEATDPVAKAIIDTQTEVRPPKAYVDLPNAEGEKQRTNLSPTQQNAVRRRFGELAKPAVEQLITSEDWQTLTPAQQQDAMDKVLSNAMRQVNAELRQQLQPAQ